MPRKAFARSVGACGYQKMWVPGDQYQEVRVPEDVGTRRCGYQEMPELRLLNQGTHVAAAAVRVTCS